MLNTRRKNHTMSFRIMASIVLILLLQACTTEPNNEFSSSPSNKSNVTPPTVEINRDATGNIEVNWNTTTEAKNYSLYISSSEDFTSDTTSKIILTAPPFIVPSTFNTINMVGSKYYLKITSNSNSAEGTESEDSNITSYTVPPLAPQNFNAALINDNTTQLTWSPVIGASSYTLYIVSTDNIGNNQTTFIENVVSPYTYNITPNQSYSYWVVTSMNNQTSADSTISRINIDNGNGNGNGGNNSGNDFNQVTFNAANILRGGRLYDKWWAEKNIVAPNTENPIWQYTATPNDDIGGVSNQWRCKECHGWDYKGREGAYGDPTSSHYSGVRGLNSTNPNFTAEAAFQFIANGVVQIKDGIPSLNAAEASHAFFAGNKLSRQDIYDLTKFIIQFANRDLVDSITGDETRGKAVYASNSCSSIGCHSTPEKKAIIIDIAQTNTPEFLHKVRLGQPGAFMPGGLTNRKAQDVLAFVKSGANTTIAPDSATFDQRTYDALDENDIALGGLLYDKWWNASNATLENTTHQLWPATNTQQSGSSTWRCKACHGWDYRGNDGAYGKTGGNNTGIQGVVTTSNSIMQMATESNVFAYLELDNTHGFNNAKFTTNEYYALTKFIMTMREEAALNKASFDFIDDATLTSIGGSAVIGKMRYEESNNLRCNLCHGDDGKKIDFADHTINPNAHEYLTDVATENPWEFIHKVRFGQPNSIMQGVIKTTNPFSASSMATAVDILSFVQTELSANIKRGGLLYDTWWNVNNVKTILPPIARNTTWVNSTGSQNTAELSNEATWMCTTCHGWDYQGKDGANANSVIYSSGIIGLQNAKNKTENQLFDFIKNGSTQTPDHSFGQYINDADILLLAKFILDDAEGIPNTAAFNIALNSTDKANGKIIFEGTSPGNCATCHGLDGQSLPNAATDIRAIANPASFIHKARFGHPGTYMVPISTQFQGLDLAEAGNVLAYAKSLNQASVGNPSYDTANWVRGGRLYDKWWAEMQTSMPDVESPLQENPLWVISYEPTSIPTAIRHTETWRCKSCHAWDYKGIGFFTNGISTSSGADNLIYKIDLRKNGAFAGNPTGLQNYIFDWIKNGDPSIGHKYGGSATAALPFPMTDKEIWDLTKFLIKGDGLIETNTRIRENGDIDLTNNLVNLVNGEGLFFGSITASVNCSNSSCHGIDGTSLTPDIFATASPLSINNLTGNPWGFLHKVRFGQPGTAMPSLISNSLPLNDAYDILGYAQKRFIDRQSAR